MVFFSTVRESIDFFITFATLNVNPFCFVKR